MLEETWIHHAVGFKAAHDQLQPLAVKQIAPYDLGPPKQFIRRLRQRDMLPAAGRKTIVESEAIDHSNLMIKRDKRADQLRSDKSGAPDNKNIHTDTPVDLTHTRYPSSTARF
jgi:hypothetical protein